MLVSCSGLPAGDIRSQRATAFWKRWALRCEPSPEARLSDRVIRRRRSSVFFAAASILKDAVNRFGDMLDDGKANESFRP